MADSVSPFEYHMRDWRKVRLPHRKHKDFRNPIPHRDALNEEIAKKREKISMQLVNRALYILQGSCINAGGCITRCLQDVWKFRMSIVIDIL